MTIKEYEKASRKYKEYEHCKIAFEKMQKVDVDKIIFVDSLTELNDVNVCHKSKGKKTYYQSDEDLIKLLVKTAKDFYYKKYLEASKDLQEELEGVELKWYV